MRRKISEEHSIGSCVIGDSYPNQLQHVQVNKYAAYKYRHSNR
jgi:hypothetical protein